MFELKPPKVLRISPSETVQQAVHSRGNMVSEQNLSSTMAMIPGNVIWVHLGSCLWALIRV